MFEDSVILKIIDYWNGHQSRPQANIPFKQPPTDVHIRKIIETVYNAGQREEEKVPIQVRVVFFNEEPLNTETQTNKNIGIFFEKRLPFTVESLVKLALAFDPLTTAIIVSTVQGSPDDLEITGACCSTKRGRTRLECFSGYYPLPDVFTVAVKRPGYLVISRGGSIVCHYKDNVFQPPIPTPFHSRALGGFMHKVVSRHVEFQKYGNEYWGYYVDVMKLLLSEGQQRGHGGTFVWLPEESVDPAEELIIPKHTIQKIEGLPQSLFSELVDTKLSKYLDATSTSIIKAKRVLVEYIEFIAQLSCVDGALIITDKFKPLSIGAQLKAPTWTGNILTGPDVLYNRLLPIDRTKKGMRHNSAVDFVGACPYSIAFVVSQDGLIGAMTRYDDNTIYWWPDCLSQMWEI